MEPAPEALPTANAVEAAVSLLGDPEERVVEACRQRVLAWGDLARPALERAVKVGEARLRARARQVLRTLELRRWHDAVAHFADAARRRRSRLGASVERRNAAALFEGALLVSGLLRSTEADRAALHAFVEREALALGPRLIGKTSATGARLLAEELAGGVGLAAESACHYELDHVLVGRVVERGQGMPVALGLIYLLVARRVCLEACGVILPEHFLVRIHGGRPILVDPAHEGRLVTKADCMRYLRSAGHGIHMDSYLDDASDAMVLGCLLRALHRVFGYREDREVCIAIEAARRGLLGPG